MPETTHQPRVEMDRESITFVRSDGLSTTISVLELLDSDDPGPALQWATLMKLTELSEIGKAQLVALQQIAQVATTPPNIPDPSETLKTTLAQLGLSPEMMQSMASHLSKQPGAGVTFEQES